MPSPSNRGAAVVEFLASATVVLFLLLALVQLAFLFAGQGAVQTAAHFAARKFALNARTDIRKAPSAALAEASQICRNRPGARWADASMTRLDVTEHNSGRARERAAAGQVFELHLTHWVELVVPWVDRILFAVAPGLKIRIGDKYYLAVEARRLLTVE